MNYNWIFVFLGANQDSFQEAEKMGISRDYTSGYTSSKVGTTSGYKKFSKMTTSARKGEKFIDEDEWIKDSTPGSLGAQSSPNPHFYWFMTELQKVFFDSSYY